MGPDAPIDLERVLLEFDEEFYLETNPDVVKRGVDPFDHFMTHGWTEGRDPNAEFSFRYYKESNPDIAELGMNPFVHYVVYGRAEGRKAKSDKGFRGHQISIDINDVNPVLHLPCMTGSISLHSERAKHRAKVAIHLHVYYIEPLRNIVEALQMIPFEFDLFVTSDAEQKLKILRTLIQEKRIVTNVSEKIFPNRGRDLAPFLVGLGSEMLAYDYVLHLHAKKSVQKGSGFGNEWLTHILERLLKDPIYVRSIFDLLEADPQCGIIMPNPFEPVRPFMGWGANRDLAISILQRIGADLALIEKKPLNFPAGSMFWCRPQAIRQLLEGTLDWDDFPPEPLPDDGTLAHAIERSIGYIARHNGFSVKTIEPIPPEAQANPWASPEVSVIIPAFNAAAWLHVAVQSVLRQEVPSPLAEILIVDNGSTDGTAAIGKAYANMFPNVRFFVENKRGAGAARNLGLSKARGQFISFLDADDLLSYNALSNLLEVAYRTSAELIVAPLCMFTEFGINNPIPSRIATSEFCIPMAEIVSNQSSVEPWDLNLRAIFSDFGPCAKIYRLEFLKKHAIRFPEGMNFEDNLFVFTAYLRANKITNYNRPVYFYRRFISDKGRTQSTAVSLEAHRDQAKALRQIWQIASSIPNVECRQLIRESILQKLEWSLPEIDLFTRIGKEVRTMLSKELKLSPEERSRLFGPSSNVAKPIRMATAGA